MQGCNRVDRYIKSLNDERTIILNGKKIENVLHEKRFQGAIKAVREYYEFQASHPKMFFCEETGLPWSYKIPKTKEDLRKRSESYFAWASASFGMMARSPDYMNSVMAGASAADLSWKAKAPRSNIRGIYEQASQNDWCWTHACVPWKSSRPEHRLRVVERHANGIFISGLRSVATLAPASEWLFCFQASPSAFQTTPSNLALSFITPLATPGITLLCPQQSGLQNSEKWPLDEIDCLVHFERCFIPYEQVLIDGDGELYDKQGQTMAFEAFAGHQVLMRRLARTHFLFGMAHLLVHVQDLGRHVHVNEKLGEFVTFIETLESLALAAVEGSSWNETLQAQVPHARSISSAMRLYGQFYEQMKKHLLSLGASRITSMPDASSLAWIKSQNPSFTPLMEKPWQEELLRAAWTMISSEWSGRERLYEHNFFGDPQLLRAALYERFDKTFSSKMVLRYLKSQVHGN